MFKKEKKEIEKKMLIRKTINTMNKQIAVLEEQKNVFIEKAKQAKNHGLESQYHLALTGFKMTLTQQKRAQEMLLNFEITSQMKDMTLMTKDFLSGMSVLSKQMAKLANQKEFLKVQEQFEIAMNHAQTQSEQMELFMENSKDSFATASGSYSAADETEIKNLIEKQNISDEFDDEDIENEIKRLRKDIESDQH